MYRPPHSHDDGAPTKCKISLKHTRIGIMHYKQIKNITGTNNQPLNSSQLEGDIFKTNASGSISTSRNSGSFTRFNKVASLSPEPQINDRLRKELDDIKRNLRIQRRYNCLSLFIAITAMLILVIKSIIYRYDTVRW